MSNQSARWGHWLGWLLPQDCFACGAPSGDGVLCRACHDMLPGRDRPRCPRCALPQPTGSLCGACLRDAPPFEATRAALDYAFPADSLVLALKYAHRLATTRLFVELLTAAPRPAADVVVPMPLHPARLALGHLRCRQHATLWRRGQGATWWEAPHIRSARWGAGCCQAQPTQT